MGDLIARLEAATGADRELDAQITVALDIRADWLRVARGEIYFDGEMIGAEPVIRFRDERMKRSAGNPPSGHCPAFTASIDAAMTLVPAAEHWPDGDVAFDLGVEYGIWTADFTAFAKPGEDMSMASPLWVRAPTGPLALCIASLRARQAAK